MSTYLDSWKFLNHKFTRESNKLFAENKTSTNGKPNIIGIPFDIYLKSASKVDKQISLKANTFILATIYYKNYEGEMFVSINKPSLIQYWLSKTNLNPSPEDYDFKFQNSHFRMKLPKTHEAVIYMKILGLEDCEFVIELKTDFKD